MEVSFIGLQQLLVTLLYFWVVFSTLLVSMSRRTFTDAARPLACPAGCKCRPETLDDAGPVYTIDCAGNGLQSIPDLGVLIKTGPTYANWGTGGGRLVVAGAEAPVQWYLENNLLASVNKSQFKKKINVFSLDISRNKKLSNIPADAFHNLAPTLERLSLEALSLTFDRPLSMVSELGKLKHLSISHNNRRGYVPGAVEHVTASLFEGPLTKSLTVLKMSHCGMRSLSERSLSSLTSLEKLDLSNNWFTQVPDSIKPLTKLKKLSLFHCYIKKLADYSFTRLTRLESLDLSANHVAQIEPSAFTGLENSLLDLRLSRCHLTAIPTTALRILNKLDKLDLSENRFTEAGPGAFKGDYCLTDLLVSARGMDFSPKAFADQSECVVSLTIKQMELAIIPRQAVAMLKNLRRLSLDNNQIKSLPPDAFSGISALSIRLNGNPLTTIEDHAFRGLPSKLDINLSHTKVSGIEFLLGYPEDAISSVNLDYAGLVCRCSMQAALNASRTADIYGSCRSGNRDVLLDSRELPKIVEEACLEEAKRNSATIRLPESVLWPLTLLFIIVLY